MSTTEPIKDLDKLRELKNYYLEMNDYRNYALVSMGVNTALRISDLLSLRWCDVYDFENKEFRKHVIIIEKKTGKRNKFAINKSAIFTLKRYKKNLPPESPLEYLFKSQKGNNRPITRNQAFRIIKNAANAIGLEGNISCHSLRKTFGYWIWKNGASPVLIMNIFNHSSFEITKRYLCIDQDDKDEIYMTVNL